jgi:hypothetical protein
MADTNVTEEYFLIGKFDYESVDNMKLTRALVNVLPGKKVWVVEEQGGELERNAEPL